MHRAPDGSWCSSLCTMQNKDKGGAIIPTQIRCRYCLLQTFSFPDTIYALLLRYNEG